MEYGIRLSRVTNSCECTCPMNLGIVTEPSPLSFLTCDEPVYHSRRVRNRLKSLLGTSYGMLAIPAASLLSVTVSAVWQLQ